VPTRLTKALAALALFGAALVFGGGVAHASAASRPCPTGSIKNGYSYGCTPSPSPSTPTPSPSTPTPSSSTPPPTTAPPTTPPVTTSPPLPVTGPEAAPIAWAGLGLVGFGAIATIWAALFIRRHRFEA
jgi:hypothetical protein